MATGERVDPFHGFNFRVEIDRIGEMGFRECSGLSFTTDVVDYREGTDLDLSPRKLTGMRKFANLVFKRGITKNKQLFDWYRNVLNGIPDRRGGSIVLLDEERADSLRWEFTNGFICKWDGPTFNATSNEVAIESIEICVERVVLSATP
jgi:phage tail-like protein